MIPQRCYVGAAAVQSSGQVVMMGSAFRSPIGNEVYLLLRFGG